jgi:hypothetical protein
MAASMKIFANARGQSRPRLELASAKLIWIAKSTAVAALLPFGLATLSRSAVVIRSSLGLALGGLFCLFLPLTAGKLMVVIFTWVAALLVALSGIRTRDAEAENRILRDEIRRYQETHSTRERTVLKELLSANR